MFHVRREITVSVWNVRTNFYKSLEWDTLSSNQKNNKAQNNIGILYYVGDGDSSYKGFKADIQKSLDWITISVTNGNVSGLTNIDQSFLFGRDDKRFSELIVN